MKDTNYLWITTGGEGLAVAREVAKSTPTICWGDFMIHGEDTMLPQYRIWDKINHWMQARNIAPDNHHIIIDGFMPFTQPHVLNGKTHRNTADFLPAIGGGKSSKLFNRLGSDPLLAREVAYQNGVSTVPIINCDSLDELLDYVLSEPHKPHDIVSAENLYRTPSGASAHTWISELSMHNRLKPPFAVSTPPSGLEVRVLQIFHDGEPISGPVLDCRGAMCGIGQGSLIYTETLQKLHKFISEINWTGVFGVSVRAAKVDDDFHIYAEGFITELKRAGLPALSELHGDEPADIMKLITEGSTLSWNQDWVSYYRMAGDEDPRLQPAWVDHGISNKVKVWWGDVIEDRTIRRISGRMVATLTAKHPKDPRKARSYLDHATNYIISPDVRLFVINDRIDPFKVFSQLINWELCMSLQKEAKSATDNIKGQKRRGAKGTSQDHPSGTKKDLSDAKSTSSQNQGNGRAA